MIAHASIYIVPSSQKESPTGERAPRERERFEKERKQETEPSVSFFGHHIGTLLTPGKAEKDEFFHLEIYIL